MEEEERDKRVWRHVSQSSVSTVVNWGGETEGRAEMATAWVQCHSISRNWSQRRDDLQFDQHWSKIRVAICNLPQELEKLQ